MPDNPKAPPTPAASTTRWRSSVDVNCGNTACGNCTYTWLNGMYQRSSSNCNQGCTCPQTVSLVQAAALLLLCSTTVKLAQSGTLTTDCTGSRSPGEGYFSITDEQILFKLRNDLASRVFWRRTSLALGLLSLLLLAGLVYALFFR